MADTSRNIGGEGGGGGAVFNMYAFGVRLSYANLKNLSNIMLGKSTVRHCFKIQIQALKIRIQALKIRI